MNIYVFVCVYIYRERRKNKQTMFRVEGLASAYLYMYIYTHMQGSIGIIFDNGWRQSNISGTEIMFGARAPLSHAESKALHDL